MITHNNGFTTVEVLVTLFIGAILLGGGYQLYGIITRSSADTRNQTDASNIVYEQLRKYKEQASGSCSPNPPLASSNPPDITTSIPSGSALPGELKMTYTRTCPYGNGDDISLITVKLIYGKQEARSEVSHALYAY